MDLLSIKTILYLITAVMLVMLSYTDYKTQKIPNAITFPCMLIGFTLHGFPSFTTWIFLVVVFALGAINLLPMGDVKMYMATGFLLSGQAGFIILLFSQLLLILFHMIKRKSVLVWKDKITSYPLAPFVLIAYSLLLITKMCR